MGSYVCAACQLLVIATPEKGARVPCPSCERSMFPRSPLASEVEFPESEAHDSVLNLPVPEEITALEERKRQEKLKRLELLEDLDRKTRRPK